MASISREEYEALLAERKDLIEKLKTANQNGEEFIANHYKRVLNVVNRSYHSAMKASISLENRELREELQSSKPTNNSTSPER